jgi:hypothetical protein
LSGSATVPVIAGLAAGVIFLVAMALAEYSLSSLYAQPPNMFLIVDGKQYNGEKGSFCHANGCADTGFGMPQELAIVEKGSEVSVRVAGYLQPSQLYWVLANELGEDRNYTQKQEMIAQKLNSTKFVIDLDEGDYILSIQAIWAGYHTDVGNASYDYHVRVVG